MSDTSAATGAAATTWHGQEGEPIVVLVHDWNGRLPWIDDFAARLAAEGYRVAVPDFFDGATATDDAAAGSLLRERLADMPGALHLVSEAIGEARALGSQRAAVVGFSMGASIALAYAAQGSLDAVVAYYGSARGGITPRVPVLFQLAETDDWTGVEAPEDLQVRLAAEGFDGIELLHHEGAVHGFQNAQVERRFHADASAAAWDTTLAFLREHLQTPA
ncbi:MAG: dienelactone hydrolase family protein [Actinomycetota bacterium]